MCFEVRFQNVRFVDKWDLNSVLNLFQFSVPKNQEGERDLPKKIVVYINFVKIRKKGNVAKMHLYICRIKVQIYSCLVLN